MNRKLIFEIGKVTYTVNARFAEKGKTTAKNKLLRIMERDLQKNFSQNIGQPKESVIKYG